MSDIKDILGLQRAGPSDSLDVKKERPAKEPKAQRPAGMSREAFALLGDSHPIAPSELANELKKPGDAQVKLRSWFAMQSTASVTAVV